MRSARRFGVEVRGDPTSRSSGSGVDHSRDLSSRRRHDLRHPRDAPGRVQLPATRWFGPVEAIMLAGAAICAATSIVLWLAGVSVWWCGLLAALGGSLA